MDKNLIDSMSFCNDEDEDENEYVNEPNVSSVGLNVLIEFLKEKNHSDKDIVELIYNICNKITQNENTLLSCNILLKTIDFFKNNKNMSDSEILDCIVYCTK